METLELEKDTARTGTCLVCGRRSFVCTLRRCRRCHAHRRDRQREGRVNQVPAKPDAVELCCGWWGPLSVLPWSCPTCSKTWLTVGAANARRRA